MYKNVQEEVHVPHSNFDAAVMLQTQSCFKPDYSHNVSLSEVMVVKLCSEQHRLFCFTEMQVISVTARYPVTLSRVKLRSSSKTIARTFNKPT